MNLPFTLHLPFDGHSSGGGCVPLRLEVTPTASGISVTLFDESRHEDDNPIAHFRTYNNGSKNVLEVEPWDELNAGNGGSQTITLYDLREPDAQPLEQPAPGVLLHLEGGVIQAAQSNILGLDLRVFDPELVDDEDAEGATNEYPWVFAPLTTADHWAAYENAYTDDSRKLAATGGSPSGMAEHFLGEDAA